MSREPQTPDPTRNDRLQVHLALGRIFRMASRPAQIGDVADYERCRGLVLDALLGPGVPASEGYAPNWARDRRRGASGD